MSIQTLRQYLDQNDVRYVVIDHSAAFTAQEIAASAHIPGRILAKTVVVKVDGRLIMAVLPASYKIDFGQLKVATGAKQVELAKEADFKAQFPDCDTGAMPPFGNLYGIPVYVAKSLIDDEEIAFNACTHAKLIRMAYADFARLVKPTVLEFSRQEKLVAD